MLLFWLKVKVKLGKTVRAHFTLRRHGRLISRPEFETESK